MEKDDRIANPDNKPFRNKRVKCLKKWIIIIVLALLILPTILCVIMFFKINSLQKQIDVLMIQKYGLVGSKDVSFDFAYAATKYNENSEVGTSKEENNLYKSIEDFPSSLEETAKNEYNSDEVKEDSSAAKSDAVSEDSNEWTKEGDTKEEGIKDSATEDEIAKSTTNEKDSKESSSVDEKTADSLIKSDAAKSSLTVKENQNSETTNEDTTGTKSNMSSKKNADILDKTGEGTKGEFEDKTVYLTFDDGPSKYTDEILKLLEKYQVKATFFVIGKTDEASKEMYKKIVEEGHSLGMHSYSHDYKKIYNSLEDFDKDFTRIRNLLYDTTGYLSNIYRFPGGSGNTVCKEDMSVFINYLNEKKVVYFDWNVVSGDATGIDYTAKELYENAINGIKLHDRSIVLMHDTDAKENTVKSLDMILKELTKEGAAILPLDEEVAPIQQVKSNSSGQKN